MRRQVWIATLGATALMAGVVQVVTNTAQAATATPPVAGISRMAPAITSMSDGRVDVVVTGTDRSIWHKAYYGTKWSGWTDLGGTLDSSPAVTSSSPGRLDIVARGPNNNLYYKYYSRGGWSSWLNLGGNLLQDPAITSWGTGRMDIVAHQATGGLAHRYFDKGVWSTWQSLGGQATSGPAITSMKAGSLDVVVRDTALTLKRLSFRDGKWGTWENLGNKTYADPSITSMSDGRLDIVARNTAGYLVHRTWQSTTGWGAWAVIDGLSTSSPDVTSSGPGVLNLTVASTNGALSYRTYTNGKWNGWGGLGIATSPIADINTIGVATWNAYVNNSNSEVAAGMTDIFKTADVVGLQELSSTDRRAYLKDKFVDCSGCQFATYMPPSSEGGKNPIFWKKNKFSLLGAGSDKVYSETKVENGTAGTTAPAKFLVWVHLRDNASYVDFYLINTHIIPGIDDNGHPVDKPKRIALAKKHIDMLADKIAALSKTGAPVFATGDFNVDWKDDSRVKYSGFPYAKLKAVNTYANWDTLDAPKVGTHHDSSRLIDYVWESRDSEATPISQAMLAKHGSDHSPVVVKVSLRG